LGKIDRLPSGHYRTRICWTENGVKRSKSLTAPTKKELQRMMMDFSVTLEEKTGNGTVPMTLEKALNEYVKSKDRILSPTTIRSYRSIIRTRYGSIKGIEIDRLTNADIQRYFNGETGSPKTLRNISGLLTATLRQYRPGFSFSLTLPQRKKKKISIPTEEEMDKIVEESYKYGIELPVMLAAYQGLRMSEITGLRWSKVNMEEKSITIDTAKVITEGGKYVLKSPKTASGERSLRMVPQMYGVFLHYERRTEIRLDSDQFVTPYNNSQISERYRAMMEKLNLPYTFHQLRHYACSVMLGMGIPVKYIADFLGHSSENMVNTVYGHILAKKREEFFSKYEEYYAQKE